MKKVIDLFAGCGGFSVGFGQAGFDIIKAVEFDKSIANSYLKIIQTQKLLQKILVRLITKITSQNMRQTSSLAVHLVKDFLWRDQELEKVQMKTISEIICLINRIQKIEKNI